MLAEHVGRHVTVRGVLKHVSTNRPGDPFRIALLHDVELLVAHGPALDIDSHAWLQFADALAALPRGSRVCCTCLVWQYRRNADSADGVRKKGEADYGLRHPRDVRVISPPAYHPGLR